LLADNPISISLNFDSLNEAYGFPAGYRDPSFFAAFDRLAELAARLDFPLSIYVIGKDLEHPEHAARVREWHQMGHEIGNHTWTHHFNIGALPRDAIKAEIERAHDRIGDVTGIAPVGFICPAWATSKAVLQTLAQLRYQYDTSTFPSALLYPMTMKIALNHRGHPAKALRMLHRKDWLAPLAAPLHPYAITADGARTKDRDAAALMILPLPTTGRLAPAIWHTIGYALTWERCFAGLRALLASHPGFYYLIHPGDFLAPEELHPTYRHSLARMDVPLNEKMARLADAFAIMKASGRPVTTLREAAAFHRSQL
jgi:peptidoglycan/xylan/chitin deacetylase (PgdA/CDA1 family)